MTQITSKCLCFFERKPNTLKIELTKTLIRQYEIDNIKFADSHTITEENEIINVLFKNPTIDFIESLKKHCDVDLKPCLEE